MSVFSEEDFAAYEYLMKDTQAIRDKGLRAFVEHLRKLVENEAKKEVVMNV